MDKEKIKNLYKKVQKCSHGNFHRAQNPLGGFGRNSGNIEVCGICHGWQEDYFHSWEIPVQDGEKRQFARAYCVLAAQQPYEGSNPSNGVEFYDVVFLRNLKRPLYTVKGMMWNGIRHVPFQIEGAVLAETLMKKIFPRDVEFMGKEKKIIEEGGRHSGWEGRIECGGVVVTTHWYTMPNGEKKSLEYW